MQSFAFKIWKRRFFWLTRKKKIYAACFQLRIMAWRYIFTHACPRRKGKKLRNARAVRSHFSILIPFHFFFISSALLCSARRNSSPIPFSPSLPFFWKLSVDFAAFFPHLFTEVGFYCCSLLIHDFIVNFREHRSLLVYLFLIFVCKWVSLCLRAFTCAIIKLINVW